MLKTAACPSYVLPVHENFNVPSALAKELIASGAAEPAPANAKCRNMDFRPDPDEHKAIATPGSYGQDEPDTTDEV
jgi:hypothetical protein